MMDFNSSSSISARSPPWSTPGCSRPRPASPSASTSGPRSGWPAERALQFEYAKAPIDHGRDTPGRMLRIFERGHVMEDCMVAWLRDAGFDLRTRKADGEQFGFSVADGRLQGAHRRRRRRWPRGLRLSRALGMQSLGNKSWSDLEKKGLAISKPIYAAQVAIYQTYLELHEHPAIFTALNADTMEIYTELVPFDAALPSACRIGGEGHLGHRSRTAPRGFHDPTHFECRMCVARPLLEDASMTDNTQHLRHRTDDRRQTGLPRCACRITGSPTTRCAQKPHSPLPDGWAGALSPVRTVGAARNAAAQSRSREIRISPSRGRMIDFNDTAVPTGKTAIVSDADGRTARRTARRLESVLATLFPAGKKRRGKFLIGDVLGSPGDSLEVVLDGEKAGPVDGSCRQLDGGDIFTLIGNHFGIDVPADFLRVLDAAADLLGRTRSTPVRKANKNVPVDELGPRHRQMGLPRRLLAI